MGLDMYFYLKKTAYNGSYGDEKKLAVIRNKYDRKALKIAEKFTNFQSYWDVKKYLAGYLRKANAIHNWIIENCANGLDECQPIYMGKDSIESLIEACDKALTGNDEVRAKVLPTSDGFFFGSTEYDEYYLNDVRKTKEMLTEILDFLKTVNDSADWSLEYQASW